ncbi:MAG: TolC family protein [Chitinophagaceae bacterium]|nr:TolC family protein [Chitinophagaceae bacterium]
MVHFTLIVNNRKKVLHQWKRIFIAGWFICFATSGKVFAQQTSDTMASYNLSQCIDYAMQHEPALQQTLIRMNIVKATNAINTSGWYPQAGLTANLSHYLQQPTSLSNINGVETPVKTGIINTSVPGIGITQTIYDPSLVYASKTGPVNIKQAQQVTDSTKINIVVSVSKNFYNLLFTLLQIDVLKEDTARLGQSMRDAQHQYIGGIVDETDYEQATISLNTSLVQLKQAQENIYPLYQVLKQNMGFPPDRQFNVLYDTTEMLNSAVIDTSKQLNYEKRIEYQQLLTAKDLQHKETEYYQKAYLPTLQAFYNYNYSFQKNQFAGLYSTAYPNSLIGLTLSMPIFTGFSRTQSLHRSRLQEQLLDWSEIGLKSEVYSEYASALASYKGNLYNMQKMQDNVALAKRVYFVVDLQYKQGVVPYLNVITAETNLRTSELTYLNALFQVLSSKIDWQRAMGDISY